MTAQFESPLFAAVDVGSHSVKLRLARRDPAAGWRTACEQVVITKLGCRELGRSGLSPAGRARTLAALQGFAALATERGVTAVAAVATMVLRQSPDAGAFVAEVHRSTGIDLEVISGQEEARLGYLGAFMSQPPTRGETILVVDIGGASTELAWGRRPRPEGCCSLELGTITLTEAHALDRIAATRVAAARAQVAAALAAVPAVDAIERILAIGATPASLLSLHDGLDLADSARGHGRELARDAVRAQIERLQRLPAAARRDLPGLHPDRAVVILAGAIITAEIGRRWPRAPMIVSAGGLRLGLLEDRFGPRPDGGARG